MINSFLKDFLAISDVTTLVFVAVLVALFVAVAVMYKKKLGFNKMVMISTLIGLALGIVIQLVAGVPKEPTKVTFINEVATWYNLFGYGYMNLIRMILIPLIVVSIIHVIISMKQDAKIGKLVKYTVTTTMIMVAIAAVVGLVLGIVFNLGAGTVVADQTSKIKVVTNIASTILALVPSNPVAAMVNLNVVGIVIFAVFFGIGARQLNVSKPELVKPFNDVIYALYDIVVNISLSIFTIMPFALIPLLASTIATQGFASIMSVVWFIIALYLGIIIMLLVQFVALLIFKVNPINYFKKGLSVFLLAFTSRSSVGTLPLTIEALTNKFGVNKGTASFVASFSSTAGMQGCAGVFPALLIIYVARLTGVPIDLTLIIMSVIVVTIGSVGIAGIPGTATMAASVGLSGVGMAASFPLITPVLAIDPLIDMGRTMLNVSGGMVNAIIVDKKLGQLDEEVYNDMTESADSNLIKI